MDTTVKKCAVTVIIPCYNQGCYVVEAIDSVLASDFQDLEIIVINDGSTEPETKQIVSSLVKPKTTIINQENQGLVTARNNGIKAANSEFFMPLDSDDTIEPTYISKAYKRLKAEPRLGYVYSSIRLFGDENHVDKLPPYDFYRLLWNNRQAVCALVRKEAWEDIGGYNPNMAHGWEDWDFWINLGKHGWHGQLIPEPLFNYRRHGATMLFAARKKKKLLEKLMRNNHREIYFDKARLRELRHQWPAMPPFYPTLLATREASLQMLSLMSYVFPKSFRKKMRQRLYGQKPDRATL